MKKQTVALTITLATTLAASLVLFWLLGEAGSADATPALAGPLSPGVTAVDPVSAPNDLDTAVVISGTGFTAGLSGSLVITPPAAYLGEAPLDDVTWVSSTTLSATIPWGLEPGVYTLTVTNPDGATGSLPDAFTVTHGIGVWTSGGPYGGQINLVRLHPDDPATVYAAAQWVGLFVSEDKGENWRPILPVSWPTRLEFDAGDADVMYYSADSASFYRSDDRGGTWEPLSIPCYVENGCFTVYAAAHPTTSGVIYAGIGGCADIPLLPGEGGLYYSEDYGANWVTRTLGLTDTDTIDVAFHPSDPATMALATPNGHIFRTGDGGLNWELASSLPVGLRRVYFNPYGAHEAWALPVGDDQVPVGPFLYKSTDLLTWDVITLTQELMPAGGVMSLSFAPGEIWAAGYGGYFSDDGGASWTPVVNASELELQGIRSFALDPGDPAVRYAADNAGGVLKTNDGSVTWEKSNRGLAALTTRDLAVTPGHPDIVYVETSETGLLKSANGGYAWQELGVRRGGAPSGKLVAVDPFIPARVYFPQWCSGNAPCIWYSPDAGASWHESTLPLPATYAGWTGDLTAIAAHPQVTGTLFAGAAFHQDGASLDPAGIYRSDDHGLNWQFVGPTSPISEVLDFAFDAANPDLIYAATYRSGLWRSTNGGLNWAQLPITDVQSLLLIEAIATHPQVPGKLFVRTASYAESPNPQSHLWLSEDAGDTWQEISEASLSIDLLISPPLPGPYNYALYTGCADGLCRSTDDGATWGALEGTVRPEMLAGTADGERVAIYMGTFGGLATSVEGQAVRSWNTTAADASIFGGGIYRLTSALPTDWVYLPFVLKGHTP
jgi:photosystem II stability/assembly factor-like uncharacterized protein